MKTIKATKADAAEIANIEHNSGYRWGESYKEELKTAKRLLKSKSQAYFAVINKEKVGYVAFSISDKSARIDFLSVLKKYHGRGIGTKLLKYAINSAKKLKIKMIRIAVWEKNKAVKLYQKLGFIIVRMKKRYYLNGDGKLIMEKKV